MKELGKWGSQVPTPESQPASGTVQKVVDAGKAESDAF